MQLLFEVLHSGRGTSGPRAARAFAVLALIALGAPETALALDLPIIRPEHGGIEGPAYLGDRLELRLRPGISRHATPALSSPATVRLDRLGVAGVDRLAGALGAWFEPEFHGEVAPEPGSDETDFTAFFIVHFPETVELENALARFGSLPEVASADPIAVLPVSAIPNDSLWSLATWFYQPSRRDIHAPEAWNVTTGDPSVVVGILDTGVLAYHPDLGGTVPGQSGQIWTNAAEANGVPGVDDDRNGFDDDSHGWDFVHLTSSDNIPECEDWETPDNDPRDYAGHGTAVAGVVGALSNNGSGVTGTAWNVRLMPLRIGWATNQARLGLVDMSFVADAIRYATRNGADIINCSFATLNQSGLFEATSAAIRAGVIVVAAAGNQGQVHELADRDDVIAVTGTNASDQVSPSANTGAFVDLAAPGVGIVSTFVSLPGGDCIVPPDYSFPLTGTSFSAPMTAGAAALALARQRALGRPDLTPVQMLLRLRETTDDIVSLNPGQTGYGTGRLNAYRLLVDPRRSSAERIGGQTAGPAVMLPTVTGRNLAVHVTANARLLFLGDRDDTLRLVTLPGVPFSGLSAARLAAGGKIGLFASLFGGRLAGYDEDGAPLPGWPVSIGAATTRLSLPALGDLDGDGAPEIVCGGSDGYVRAWHVDGTMADGFPAPADGSPIHGSVALADLDGVPGSEIVLSTTTGSVYAFSGAGVVMPGWPVSVGRPVTTPVIGRKGTRPAPTIFVAGGSTLRAIDPTGTTEFSVPLTVPAGGFANQDLALGDLNGDGADEIVAVTRAPAMLAVFDSSGARMTTRWPRALPDTAKGPPVFGQLRGGSGTRARPEIAVFVGGNLLAFTDSAVAVGEFPKPGGAGTFPTLVELDRNGATQVLAGTGPDSTLFVYDAGPGSAEGEASPWYTPRGNFARTGSRLESPVISVPDSVAPAAVTDVGPDSIGITAVALTWTAPGDDGILGRAASYELRYATFRLDAASFAGGDSASAPAPGPPGRTERAVVSGLDAGTTYFFALRAKDEAGNAGEISNLMFATPGHGEPGRVLDLTVVTVRDTSVTLRWSATGDDGASGLPARYRIAYGSGQSAVVPANVPPGLFEEHTVGGLTPGRTYTFVVTAEDVDGNSSSPSSAVSAHTPRRGPLADRVGIAIASGTQPTRLPVELHWQVDAAVGPSALQSIRIHDIAGRLVRVFPLEAETEGVVQWNGRDKAEGLVPAGVYYARLVSGSFHSQTRVVLIP